MPCLLKVALKKEENEETQKEVEIALLALSNIECYEMNKELYLSEIKEIIKYHQEHQNLTRLAYQSAWEILINRFYKDEILEDVMVNEAAKELEELEKCVDWKRKEREVKEKERREESVIKRWMHALKFYLRFSELWNEEHVELIRNVVQIFRDLRDNHREISKIFIQSLSEAAHCKAVKVEDLLISGAVDNVLEEMKQSTLYDELMWNFLHFFLKLSERLKEKESNVAEEEKRKELKRKIFEKLEEEGYEDFIKSFNGRFDLLYRKRVYKLSIIISDYFLNV
ncbi:uncharacterized protein MONOS_7594 [Monocercomonoides exilis]|uniref:uncharacterized protein n=1 Tax=Monocercomonoides exilis TaxID=2049356 RepID=UPI00355AB471|nr:hypothetical protein MONOS_7594 [Monocercomonoides exilis]|eukprot:MONOS_7594.1-p1 / transcript=MONOS_7594.1 / gene=MONOS_7594 / organism=Monocercomonoides_exilis_PA203 / gene_product=unspecified product / transcript_product=unspecified product / location=Mono_scaffold00263:46043-46951(-) / protein_length=283 / sequence_SO=supercontig / SO=protein_coding / is_pseudo=false